MIDTITIFEDRDHLLEDYEIHESNLEALADIVGRKNYSLQTNGKLHISHYVGFYQRGNTRIQILPKIYIGDTPSETEPQESLDFIYRLLSWSDFLKFKKLDGQSVSSTENYLLEIFISIFIKEFNQKFQRRYPRQYQERVETQQFIKGKILFSDTLRAYPVLRHLHIVATDELSIDNSLNRIFKAIIYSLLRTTRSNENRRLLILGMNLLDDVTLMQLRKDHFASIRFTRLNKDFEPLFNMARLFFFNLQPGMIAGGHETFSFLVPLNDLFESFIGKMLTSFSEETYRFLFKGNERRLLKAGDGRLRMKLKPDFSVKVDEETVCILDAKYKCPWDGDKVKLNEDDVYQMCAYALRYGVKKLFLIYPLFRNSPRVEAVIQEFIIPSGMGEIQLTVVQVDICEEDIGEIAKCLRTVIREGLSILEVVNAALRP